MADTSTKSNDNSNSFMAKKGLNRKGRKRGTSHGKSIPGSSRNGATPASHSATQPLEKNLPEDEKPPNEGVLEGGIEEGGDGEGGEDDHEFHGSCAICSSETVPFIAVGACFHPICSICALRMRMKSKEKRCALCKAHLSHMLVFSQTNPNLTSDVIRNSAAFQTMERIALEPSPPSEDEFQLSHYPDVRYDSLNQLLYYKCDAHFQQMDELKAIYCPCCYPTLPSSSTTDLVTSKGAAGGGGGKKNRLVKFPNYKQLLNHLNNSHSDQQVTLCSLCLEHRPLFISEHQLFYKNKGEYKAHLQETHCACKFCNNQYFFDKYLLYQHLQTSHHICHLCDQSMMFRYYKDLSALRDHHRTTHFICSLCDADTQIRSSDICYAYRQLEDYLAHMKEIHSIVESTYRNKQQSSSASALSSLTASLFSFASRGSVNTATNPAQDYLDLDVGTANPFVNRNNSNQPREDSTLVVSSSPPRHFPSLDPSLLANSSADTLVGGDAKDIARLIPPNMQIAGKVTGTGRFQKLDKADLELQKAAEQAHQRQQFTYAKQLRKGVNNSTEVNLKSEEYFPSLNNQKNITNDDSDIIFIERDGVEGEMTTAAAAYTNLTTKIGGSQTIHPMSLIHQQKQKEKERKEQELVQEQENANRVNRVLQLAEAFGVTDDFQKMSESLLFSTSTPDADTADNATFAMIKKDEYKRYLLEKLADNGLHISQSLSSYLTVTLYPMELMIWGKNNKFELIKIEKKIHQLITSPKTFSVSLKPMEYQSRQIMHTLAKYYACNSYEYDYEPKRYVSIVKTKESKFPMMLLSDAIAYQPLNSMTSSNMMSAYTPALNKLYTSSGIENPIIYFVLTEGVFNIWSKGTDNNQKKPSPGLGVLSSLSFNLHGVIVGEFIYYLQSALAPFDISLSDLLFSGNCYSVGVRFKDFTAARNAFYYLQMIYEAIGSVVASSTTGATIPTTSIANSAIHKRLLQRFDAQLLLLLSYYRLIPDFVVNSNTKEEFDQYHNIFSEFIVVSASDLSDGNGNNNQPRRGEVEEFEGRDAWDDDAPVAASSVQLPPPGLNLPPKVTPMSPPAAQPATTNSSRPPQASEPEDWEDMNDEWEEFLAQKRQKNASTSGTGTTQQYYQVKPISTDLSNLEVSNKKCNTNEVVAPSSSVAASAAVKVATIGAGEIELKQEQIEKDFALAVSLAEGDGEGEEWRELNSSSMKSLNSSSIKAKPASAVSSTSAKSTKSVNNNSGKATAVPRNRFKALHHDDEDDDNEEGND